MDSDYSLSSLMIVIKKWIRKILVATILIALVSALISLALPDYYKASTTFYASNPDLASAPGIGPYNEPLYIFGNENDLDRLISLANSAEVENHLIRKFDLYKHYGIDSTSSKAELEIDLKFKSLFKTVKTKYDAVELTVEDKDPKLAAMIAKEAREATGKLAQEWIVKSQGSVTSSYDQNIADLEKRGNSVNDSIQILKRTNQVFDTRYQQEAIALKITQNNDNLYNSQAKVKFYQRHNDPDSLRKYMAMQASSENLKAFYEKQSITYNGAWSQLTKLEQEYVRLSDQISITRERKDQLNSYANASIKTFLIVDDVSVPKVKSRPKRMIIVLACTLVGFALSLFGALMIENLRRSNAS